MRGSKVDATGNWVDGSFSGSAPAVESNHDCYPDQQSRTANNLNQVNTVNSTSLDHDAKGNLLAYGGLTFAYDAFDRLIAASGTGPDGNPVHAGYVYDALGRRISKNVLSGVNPGTILFLYDGQQVIEERDDTGTAVPPVRLGSVRR